MARRNSLAIRIYDEVAVERMRDMLNHRKWGHWELDDANWEELRALMQDYLKAKKNWSEFVRLRLAARRCVDFVNGSFHIPSAGEDPTFVLYPMVMPRFQDAQGVFLQFIAHPERDRLDGPCARKRCDQYFIRKTSRKNVYCSLRCARLDTATASMKKGREAARARLAERVELVIEKHKRKHVQNDVRNVIQTETGITSRVLNGLIESGLVKLPTRKGRKR
jgi:hypothetical protein